MIVPYFIILPLLSAFLITLIAGKKDIWAALISIVTTAGLLCLAIISYFQNGAHPQVYQMGGWQLPYGIALVQDPLSTFMLIIVNLISLTSLIYSLSYIRHISQDWKYYALFMFLLSGMNGVLITGDLFNLYVFMEIALLAAFALVAYGTKAEEFEAAFKYAVMGSVSSLLILLAIAITYSVTSTLTLAKISQELPDVNPVLVKWVGGLFLAGFGLKAAAMPFHAWLPDAHPSAPAPISSMLSGVLIKVLGVYVLIRI